MNLTPLTFHSPSLASYEANVRSLGDLDSEHLDHGPESQLQTSASDLDVGNTNSSLELGDNLEFSNGKCTGQLVKWVAGSIWETYAYQQHNDDLIGWTPVGFKGSNQIRLQSKLCSYKLQSAEEHNHGSCRNCFALLNSSHLEKFMSSASTDAAPYTPWKYLNARQLKNLLISARKKSRKLELDVRFITNI